MKGINFKKDKEGFDALNLKVLNWLKSNDSNLNAVRWCNPIIHPITKDIFFTIKDRILPILTGTEKSKSVKLSKDWFPKTEI